MNNIIFLDIDGVLNSNRSCVALGGFPFPEHGGGVRDLYLIDTIALGLIQRLVEDHDCKVVLSSTWRKFCNLEMLAQELELPIIGKTKELWCLGCNSEEVTRGHEIRQWLVDNCWKNGQEPTFIIIDDDSDMLREQQPMFIHVDGRNGFSFDNWKDADKIFKEDKNELA